jgi:hypothetical protein
LFVLCQVTFWVLLASYYSRFRPHTRRAREALHDWQLSQLSARVEALAEQVSVLTRERQENEHRTATEEPPKS